MHVTTAQCLGIDHFASGRLDQRRSPKKNCPLVFDDDRLVAHRRYVCTAGSAGPENGRYLWNALGRKTGLVVENSAEMLAIGEDFVLHRQEGTTRIDQVNARQVILFSNFLGAQVFLDGKRVIGTALDGRIIGDNHAIDVADLPDARYEACGWHFVVIETVSRELSDLEERRATINDRTNSIAWQQFASRQMPVAGAFTATCRDLLTYLFEIFRQFAIC